MQSRSHILDKLLVLTLERGVHPSDLRTHFTNLHTSASACLDTFFPINFCNFADFDNRNVLRLCFARAPQSVTSIRDINFHLCICQGLAMKSPQSTTSAANCKRDSVTANPSAMAEGNTDNLSWPNTNNLCAEWQKQQRAKPQKPATCPRRLRHHENGFGQAPAFVPDVD